MRTVVFIFAFLFIASHVVSNTIYTRCDGNWNDPTIWQGGIVPTTGDNIYIINNVRITANLYLNSNYLNLSTGHEICGPFALTVSSASNAVINGVAKFSTVTINGSMTVNGTLVTTGIITVGGSLLVNGMVGDGAWNGVCSPLSNSCFPPIAGFTASDTVICMGDCINFYDNSTNLPTNWVWQFNGSSTAVSNSQNPQNICYPNAGNYNVQLIASNAQGSDTIIGQQLITVKSKSQSTLFPVFCQSYSSPSADHVWTHSGIYFDTIPNTIGCDSIITINLTILNSNSAINETACIRYIAPSGNYIWTTSGIYLDTIPNTMGCDSIITIDLTVLNCECLFIPNAFSPNEDGINDYFIPISNCLYLEYDLRIFSRWGEEIFNTQDANKSWNGMYKNNKLPIGTYVYRIKYKMKDMETSEIKYGFISLIR
ncbi:MAG: gliding motility-associated C-terminal domain-containing protein [Bacteroidota bacterium]